MFIKITTLHLENDNKFMQDEIYLNIESIQSISTIKIPRSKEYLHLVYYSLIDQFMDFNNGSADDFNACVVRLNDGAIIFVNEDIESLMSRLNVVLNKR